jgi:hypothetical protein
LFWSFGYNSGGLFFRPWRDSIFVRDVYPALKCWAIFGRPWRDFNRNDRVIGTSLGLQLEWPGDWYLFGTLTGMVERLALFSACDRLAIYSPVGMRVED